MERISHFRVLERIGEGGMGVVYKAEDEKLRRPVALKLLSPQHVGDPQRRARFLREAQAAAAVSHPAIAAVYEVGEEGETVFIAMEYVEGRTLRALMGGLPVPAPELLRLAREIAEALERAHRAGIVHRDLKPDNVMVQSDGHVKVLDFGLAKRIGPFGESDVVGRLEAKDTTLTAEGIIVGTFAYMSPEQARGQPVDARSDLFSFGVLLYEMATGRSPFRGTTPADTISAILKERPPVLSAVNPDAPPALASVVQKLLNKEREQRHASAREVLEDLRRVDAEGGGVQRAPSGVAAAGAVRSIAVLPFSDMSAAKDQDYFCEGMAEELINALVKVPGLRVAARTSAFQFKGKAASAQRIGEELGVETLLQGSVRKAGSRLRVTAQLVSAPSGYHVWSERFERGEQDVFELQDEIAASIVSALRVRLAGAGEPPRVRRPTEHLEAYHHYLKGRYHWFNRYEGGLQKAIAEFEQAIGKDPGYALAHAGLADCYSVLGMYSFLPPRVAFGRAREAADHALAIDAELAEVRSACGFIQLYFDWDWQAAEREFRAALKLNPDYVQAWSWFALLLSYLKRHDEALGAARRAQELDPLSHYAHAIAAQVHKYAGRFDEARRDARKALEQDSGFVLALFTLGQAETLLGRQEEGVAAMRKVAELTQRHPFFLGLLGWSLGTAGERAEVESLLREADERASRGHVSPFSLALLHLGLDDAERALDCLERGYGERDSFVASVGVDAMFSRLWSHSRFAALLERLRLPGPRPR